MNDELLTRAHRMIDMARELNLYDEEDTGGIDYYCSVSLEKDNIRTHVSTFINRKQYTRCFDKTYDLGISDTVNDRDGTKGEAYLRMLLATVRRLVNG